MTEETTMKMRTRTLIAAAAMAVTAGISTPASAQISGDVVKIGFITDMSSVFADIDGPGGAEAIRMAIADFGGTVDGKKIELVTADHQNKTDVAANRAREWFDRDGVDLLIGGSNSAVGLALAKIATEKKKPFISVGAGTSRLTNEECSPYSIHYAYDTSALAKVTGAAVVKQGGMSWYFLSLDYSFGESLERETSAVVKASGGSVIGSAKHPLAASDFSSFVMRAQASKAQILGLANAGGDTINAIKAANEFGLTKSMKLVGLLVFINDVHALTLQLTQDMYLTDSWYWDQNEESRKWARRFFAKFKKMPSSLHAADYSAALQYLKAVKAVGTDDPEKSLAQLKSMPINDMYAKNGTIRADGSMIHDMYLMQVKKPSESKYPWDYYKVTQTVPGSQAFTTKAESKCSFWK
jgi:branched-chain amino acid transport system substrate-binding protein